MEFLLKSSKLNGGELCRRSRMLLNKDTKVKKQKGDCDIWLRNIFVFIPKKKVIYMLEGQSRSICVQGVFWQCGTCGYLTICPTWKLGMLERETRCGRISALLGSRREEVQLRFLPPLDWWRLLPRNGEMIWVSFIAQWMRKKFLSKFLRGVWAWSWKKWTMLQCWQDQFWENNLEEGEWDAH